eukprot:TRINITY_DN8534_c0_g1_i2.p1 TRINITY_DN8534_c0_g1~~TRINITY_DN8534_c0_g1_i2.p1  ORF type:complete len:183 (-),score=21.04 TRINITY_DN8534_c0_g1_i2:179-727(-)
MRLASLLVWAVACLLVSGANARGKYTWRELRALGKKHGILSAGLSGPDTTSGNVDNTGGLVLEIYKQNSDYNVHYAAACALTDSGYPTSIGIFKGAEGSTGVLQYAFADKWVNDTRNPKLKFRQKRNKYQYNFENILKKASTTLIDAMLANPKGYYAMATTAKYPTEAMRGQFMGRARRIGG